MVDEVRCLELSNLKYAYPLNLIDLELMVTASDLVSEKTNAHQCRFQICFRYSLALVRIVQWSGPVVMVKARDTHAGDLGWNPIPAKILK